MIGRSLVNGLKKGYDGKEKDLEDFAMREMEPAT